MFKIFTAAQLAVALLACAPHARADPPPFLGPVSKQHYDGLRDDLLTAGMGASGLAGLQAPAYTDPRKPTAAELRRNAIFNNYRAIVDTNRLSGFGSLYGPNVGIDGVPGTGEGKVAGTEYLAYADDGSGRINVTLMVQVPDSFDPHNPCIVAGTSSGSAGVYGAISTAGEWGLKHGCAVAYSDKGTGTGLYTFDDDKVNLRNGMRARREKAGKDAIFAPALLPAQRTAFARLFPRRVAFKHAHSQNNPEANWGLSTLQSIEFAFHVLNTQHRAATAFEPGNTIVIASSVSNGAGAALKAAEQDVGGLIDGVAVSEPQVQVGRSDGYQILQGGVAVPAHGKTLFDYATYAALYQSCIGGHLVRCASLADKGLLSGVTPVLQMADAYARMRAYGWGREADLLVGVHAATNVLIAVTYAYGYGRFPVTDSLCGLRFGSVDSLGLVRAFSAERRAQSFANQSGIPGSVLYEDALGGARAYHLAVSPSSVLADQGLDAFLCLRAMATGVDPVSGQPLAGERLAQSRRLHAGVAEAFASGNLHGKPAIVVQGRSDAMVPPNHGARAYVGLNALVEGAGSRLRYIEVTNANHFDIFASTLPSAIVPLHPYLFEALDAMYAHLKTGAPLPPSQVVRTLPRWSGLQLMTRLNLPHMQPAVETRDQILASPGMLSIPD